MKGGKNFGFAALVVVGDQKGRVGFGKGKAREVPEAIRKASPGSQSAIWFVFRLREGRTLHHDAQWALGCRQGRPFAPRLQEPASSLAVQCVRSFETLGVQDVVAKVNRFTSNPYNMVRATVDALQNQTSPRSIAAKRGKKVSEILGRRTGGGKPAVEAAPEADAQAPVDAA